MKGSLKLSVAALVFFTGPRPANTEAPSTGKTLLIMREPWAADAEITGNCGYWRAYNEDGTCLAQGAPSDLGVPICFTAGMRLEFPDGVHIGLAGEEPAPAPTDGFDAELEARKVCAALGITPAKPKPQELYTVLCRADASGEWDFAFTRPFTSRAKALQAIDGFPGWAVARIVIEDPAE